MRGIEPPDPFSARDSAAFVAILGALRDWAGRPSLRQLRGLGGTTRATGGELVDALPTSTISYVLLGKRLPRLPRRSFVDAYVAACLHAAGHPPADVPRVVGDWTTAWRALRGGAPAGRAPMSTFPRDIPDFTGRDEQLAAILGHLGSPTGATRVVAIDGMAGVGKTTLAVRAAHRLVGAFDDILFVDLHAHCLDRSPRTVPDALATLLRAHGVPSAEIPTAQGEAVAMWRTRTAAARTLVVLDNCLDAARIEPLLPAGAACGALVTSRRRLPGLDGAVAVSLDVLPAAQATDFLARLVDGDRVRAEPDAVRRLVDRVGALPLAVRLIGARLQHRPTWPVSELLAQFTDAQRTLGRLDDGQRSVTVAFALSYEQLTGEQRRAFRLLSLHPDPVGRRAVAALLGLDLAATERVLEALTDAHMVDQPRPGRYRMHDLLNAYATERSIEEDGPDIRQAAAEEAAVSYLHTAAAGHAILQPKNRHVPAVGKPAEPYVPADRQAALAWFETERVNLVAAVHRAARGGADTIAWLLAVSLSAFFETRQYLTDWLDVLDVALPCARRLADPYAESWLLASRGIANRAGHRHEEALADWEESLSIRERSGDRHGEALSLNNLGAGYSLVGRHDEAVECFRRALAIWREFGDRVFEGMALSNLADLYRQAGRHDEAVAHASMAVDHARAGGNARGEAIALHNLGRGLAGAGRHTEAVSAYDESLSALRELGERWGIAATQRFRGESLLASGDEGAARAAWDEAYEVFTEIGDPAAATVLELLGANGESGR